MTILRTPDKCFTGLQGFPYAPHYQTIEDPDLGSLRMHYVDAGPSDAEVVLCLHGEPSWSYLYRKMIPVFSAAGLRVLAPDLVGFGRSDKPSRREDYTYARHVRWVSDWLAAVASRPVTLVAQDWGGLIGLRLLAEQPERFARFSISNTGLPTGDQSFGEAFERWRAFSQSDPQFDTGHIVNNFGRGRLSDAEIAAYRAPFPHDEYKAGARQFPMLVPSSPDDVAAPANRAAWQRLAQWTKPALLCFSDGDPITRGADAPFLKHVPGTSGQPHRILHGGHFIQEDDGETWARAVVDWMG